MKVEVHASAEWELVKAATFFEEQSPALAVRFLDCLQADINRLESLAGIHEQVYGHHRILSQKFQFAIYYVIEGDIARVKAIIDCRRDPDFVKRRLGR